MSSKKIALLLFSSFLFPFFFNTSIHSMDEKKGKKPKSSISEFKGLLNWFNNPKDQDKPKITIDWVKKYNKDSKSIDISNSGIGDIALNQNLETLEAFLSQKENPVEYLYFDNCNLIIFPFGLLKLVSKYSQTIKTLSLLNNNFVGVNQLSDTNKSVQIPVNEVLKITSKCLPVILESCKNNQKSQPQRTVILISGMDALTFIEGKETPTTFKEKLLSGAKYIFFVLVGSGIPAIIQNLILPYLNKSTSESSATFNCTCY